jgi:hypothetical protein
MTQTITGVRIITKDVLVNRAIEQRKAALVRDQKLPAAVKDAMFLSLETGKIPHVQFPENFKLEEFVRPVEDRPGYLGEFIGTGDFSAQWVTRQRYEVDAGRDEEPLLIDSIYNVTTDPNLPKIFDIYTLGPAGVVFEEVTEGGEVKFASIGEGSKTVRIRHYATGLKYSEDLVVYNELFRVGRLERRFGSAFNALMNHIHFSPILTANYGANNLTDGTALTSFKATAKMAEKYQRAIEAAVTAAVGDTDNPRRGPYALLISSADLYTVQRALNQVPQTSFDDGSTVAGRINRIVVYDGWSGSRGKKPVSYTGVAAGTAYLVHIGNRDEDFQSYIKTPLRMQMGNPDISRFILDETIWDTRFGVFADPTRAVEKITLPVAASGAA